MDVDDPDSSVEVLGPVQVGTSASMSNLIDKRISLRNGNPRPLFVSPNLFIHYELLTPSAEPPQE